MAPTAAFGTRPSGSQTRRDLCSIPNQDQPIVRSPTGLVTCMSEQRGCSDGSCCHHLHCGAETRAGRWGPTDKRTNKTPSEDKDAGRQRRCPHPRPTPSSMRHFNWSVPSAQSPLSVPGKHLPLLPPICQDGYLVPIKQLRVQPWPLAPLTCGEKHHQALICFRATRESRPSPNQPNPLPYLRTWERLLGNHANRKRRRQLELPGKIGARRNDWEASRGMPCGQEGLGEAAPTLGEQRPAVERADGAAVGRQMVTV